MLPVQGFKPDGDCNTDLLRRSRVNVDFILWKKNSFEKK